MIHMFRTFGMSYITFPYYLLLAAAVPVYYIVPKNRRWVVLLTASILFYISVISDPKAWLLLGLTVCISYAAGRILQTKKSRAVLAAGILLSAAPLLMIRLLDLFCGPILGTIRFRWIVPVGLSFYTLQIVSYLADIYRGKTDPVRNAGQYALFILFFPYIIQGPIHRHSEIFSQLVEGHGYKEENIVRGARLILWGFFLKLMIADKAALYVDAVFASSDSYPGFYTAAALALYSIQLYADFLSCTTLSQGAAFLFGIRLIDNFDHPFFSLSVKEFWRRWHMSLSGWLKDYIYIPLGGSRRGKGRKYLNIIITFIVSGLWHGGSLKFILWGLMHALYQIAGDLTMKVREAFLKLIGIRNGSLVYRALKRTGTFILVSLAWIPFRAGSLTQSYAILRGLFRYFNPWVILDPGYLEIGMDRSDWRVLILSLAVLYFVSRTQEKLDLNEAVSRQSLVVRWGVFILGIAVIYVFGTYGAGYAAQNFIYGGF